MSGKRKRPVYIVVPKEFADSSKIEAIKKGFSSRMDFLEALARELDDVPIDKNKNKRGGFDFFK